MIIRSLLDTDLYKFTMMQVVYHHYPEVQVTYSFKLRSEDIDLRPFAEEIHKEIKAFCRLQLLDAELAYLQQLPFIQTDFIKYLRNFTANQAQITVAAEPDFAVSIQGPWLETILFEVPVLAIISEVYNRNKHPQPDYAQGLKRLEQKMTLIQQHPGKQHFKFSDFGTRRRFSFTWQEQVLQTLQQQVAQQFIGTSNVYYAKKFGLTPIGTMAHEYVQAFQALAPTLAQSQHKAFEVWYEEYQGQLGIALSDTLNLPQFLKDFDAQLARRYLGARQDSGDPFTWADQVIAHYQQLGIDPRDKQLVFSDSLTMAKALAIHDYVYPRSQPIFGIGTHLTNDLGYKTIDMVIKMVECNGQPVAKLSDSPGKVICPDKKYLARLEKLFDIK